MKTFISIALAGAASAAVVENDLKFMNYMSKFSKVYTTVEEYATRLALFLEREIIINESNADEANTYTLGHNNFSDWTDEEYKAILGGIPLERLEEAYEPEEIVNASCVDTNSSCAAWA